MVKEDGIKRVKKEMAQKIPEIKRCNKQTISDRVVGGCNSVRVVATCNVDN